MSKLVFPQRRPGSRKGENGRVLIVGGSREYVGALALAGTAALRSGCDIVTIAAPEKVAWAINALSPDVMTGKLPGEFRNGAHYPEIARLAKKADVILFGNGAGLRPGTRRLLRRLARLPARKVIDADGIKAVRARGLKDTILTPHRKELEIFLANSKLRATTDAQRLKVLLRDYLKNDGLILLKGPTDSIVSKHGVDSIAGGNAGLTRGGTGDVLAGLVAGLWAQGLSARQAAISASILNKRIGDALKKRHRGYSYLASDMVREIRRLRATRPPRQASSLPCRGLVCGPPRAARTGRVRCQAGRAVP